MRSKINGRTENLLALLFFILLGLLSFNTSAQFNERVIITGRIIADSPLRGATSGRLISGDGEVMNMVIRRNGMFRVNAPEADRYVLEFSRPGCVSKTVMVDAHHAGRSTKGARARKIEFDVVLHEDESALPMSYKGPVGSIMFDRGNGRMRVARRYEMVPIAAIEPPLAMEVEHER